jgi:alpha-glucosidase
VAGGSDGLCWSFSNHDVERAVSRWMPAGGGMAFARLLMAFTLSLRGSICLYQGEELGLPEAVLSEPELRDPFGIAYWPAFRGRDGSRTPMPWVAMAEHAGFGDGAAPWLPVPAAHRALAVDVQEADQESLLWEYRRFLWWRRGVPALVRGTSTPVEVPAPMVAFLRECEGQRVLAVFNLSDGEIDYDGFGIRGRLERYGYALAEVDGGDAAGADMGGGSSLAPVPGA